MSLRSGSTLSLCAGAAAALAAQGLARVLRERWARLPYAWRRAASWSDVLVRLALGPDAVCRGRKAGVLAARKHLLCPAQSVSYANTDPLLVVRGRGSTLYDEAGRAFLDTRNNVAHVGHGHPRVADAIGAQARALNTNTRYLHPNLTSLAARLLATFPAPLRDGVVFFVNSGSEANDLALRLVEARARERRTTAAAGPCGVVVLDRAYHGHTRATIGLSPYKYEHASFGPGTARPSWVERAAAPDTYRPPPGGATTKAAALASLEGALDALDARGAPCGGFFVESGMSVAGVVVAPPGYMAAAYAAVRGRGGACVADEVQTGLGRLGAKHWYAFEEHGVVPDAVTLGKPFGNGFPLAAVVASRELSDAFALGPEYFNTFGGSPVACAAGLAVLDAIDADGLRENATKVGDRLRAGLRDLRDAAAARLPRAGPTCFVGDVRGNHGLFIGVDLVRDVATKEPASREASLVCSRLVGVHRILTSLDGKDDNVIVIKPPLCFSEADADAFLAALALELDHVNALPADAAFTHTPT